MIFQKDSNKKLKKIVCFSVFEGCFLSFFDTGKHLSLQDKKMKNEEKENKLLIRQILAFYTLINTYLIYCYNYNLF